MTIFFSLCLAVSVSPWLWAHLDDSSNTNHEEQLSLASHQSFNLKQFQFNLLSNLLGSSSFFSSKNSPFFFIQRLPPPTASGSTKKLPFTFASRRSFTNSAALSAYSWGHEVRLKGNIRPLEGQGKTQISLYSLSHFI